ncbi:methylmalonyl-CoA epimerase [Hippea maritima]|uniref:Methylmalonyl-CoA epimerase n=1 Tax=Hippea maritima (strain ATCC 700847 / DSM 10411 / MH2) TaxID=760142 RepID=F2LW85_HIPMA|nr:methylmalonyl-CoA epimerase [Hippea maritima]AEA34019.1 methylmalonyl-CoA epimerase [Hippea maritima DSM 10411]
MIKKVDHIGVAVKSLDKAIALYRDVLGFELLEIEEVDSQKVRVAKFDINGVHIEFLEPTSEESPIYKYIDKKGEGLHHIAYFTDDIDGELKKLKEGGIQLINNEPVKGSSNTMIAFVHPKSSIVLTELVSKGE